jgi:adenylate cyclase
MEITVMGDAVNTASRLEGLTKEYGLDLLIGEKVAERVSEVFRLRTVDLVRVKGKKKPTEVMTVLGPLTDVPPETQEILLADYEDAILLYRRREFSAAQKMLESCLRIDAGDRLAALYRDRCHELIEQEPEPDWDGVRLMLTK